MVKKTYEGENYKITISDIDQEEIDKILKEEKVYIINTEDDIENVLHELDKDIDKQLKEIENVRKAKGI